MPDPRRHVHSISDTIPEAQAIGDHYIGLDSELFFKTVGGLKPLPIDTDKLPEGLINKYFHVDDVLKGSVVIKGANPGEYSFTFLQPSVSNFHNTSLRYNPPTGLPVNYAANTLTVSTDTTVIASAECGKLFYTDVTNNNVSIILPEDGFHENISTFNSIIQIFVSQRIAPGSYVTKVFRDTDLVTPLYSFNAGVTVVCEAFSYNRNNAVGSRWSINGPGTYYGVAPLAGGVPQDGLVGQLLKKTSSSSSSRGSWAWVTVSTSDIGEGTNLYFTNTRVTDVVTPILADYVTSTALGTTLADYVLSADLVTDLGNYVLGTDLVDTLNDYVTKASITGLEETITLSGGSGDYEKEFTLDISDAKSLVIELIDCPLISTTGQIVDILLAFKQGSDYTTTPVEFTTIKQTVISTVTSQDSDLLEGLLIGNDEQVYFTKAEVCIGPTLVSAKTNYMYKDASTVDTVVNVMAYAAITSLPTKVKVTTGNTSSLLTGKLKLTKKIN